ncbi:hypothetical protein SAMN05216553_12020 [Lentzea fradiae]|uniref:Uncharacterized protein n=1 Tax=Lentzea fradiae TaxID=200378 RepID=A0A1G8BRP9_9PSEU|nr:hypothetical protein [Lentzea fradiae]SDH35841.1 hypothetical protein SAMN05216553_12020 [Lentzea fradiae]
MGSVASRWLVPAVVVITGAAVAAGMVGRAVYSRPAEAKGTPVVPSSSVAGPLPGSAEVRLSPDSFTHPDRTDVQRVLQTYFDSINSRDFGAWRSVVTARRVSVTPEAGWVAAYESTRDGGMVVQRIEADVAGRLRVMISFVSTQDVSKAPPALPEECIRWRVVYVLVREGGGFKVDDAPENRAPQMSAC